MKRVLVIVPFALDDEGLALEPGRRPCEARIDHRLDPLAGPGGRDVTAQPEPGGGPRRTPRRAGSERGQAVGVGSGIDRQRSPV